MAVPFFAKDWESSTPEDLTSNRARLCGFIEGVPDKDKPLREV
jgi:hypothetical protein